MLIDIIPNKHIHNLQSKQALLYKPANDTLVEIQMREHARHCIARMLTSGYLERGVVLDIIRHELDDAIRIYFDEEMPDDCA